MQLRLPSAVLRHVPSGEAPPKCVNFRPAETKPCEAVFDGSSVDRDLIESSTSQRLQRSDRRHATRPGVFASHGVGGGSRPICLKSKITWHHKLYQLACFLSFGCQLLATTAATGRCPRQYPDQQLDREFIDSVSDVAIWKLGFLSSRRKQGS